MEDVSLGRDHNLTNAFGYTTARKTKSLASHHDTSYIIRGVLRLIIGLSAYYHCMHMPKISLGPRKKDVPFTNICSKG